MKKIEMEIPLQSVTLKGSMAIPDQATGIVIFSNGSGSNISNTRIKFLAEFIQQKNIGTLVFDLLTEAEDEIYENRYNIDLLVSRLIQITEWLMQNKHTKELPIGYFASGTGAAAAMRAAAYFGKTIKAVVSRGGRPDMVINTLNQVLSPTLLIVGGIDVPIIGMNKMAFDELQSVKEMKIIPKATQLFKEPGKLQEAAELAISWFKRYFLQQNKEASLRYE
ncbi:dienelactone hydrolase family protein [Flavobacterium sp. UMI-01]|uniref:dienelactone hydrolase family protein n=1 Tax=Flavobacterium sp. UMI-01 TaxID=1441053 RepID=UPI001C7E17B0|nr:alpha/beta hydrolase [Flavobacterium sp. UMI-01]GIZ08427.1 DeoR family transcriptional regulator [Flavobacterium sp. UMI-01]